MSLGEAANTSTVVIAPPAFAAFMTTALRPILNHGETFFPTEKKFFLAHWFDVLEQRPVQK